MILCVLLAAGESRRFGWPKALAKLNNQTIIEHIQKTLLASKIGEIIIVLGAESKKIKPFVLTDKRIQFVVNKNFKEGQTSSFKAGLKAASANAKGIMLLPVDTPLIRKETLDSLIDCFLKNNPLILMPVYQGKPGHPPIFNISLREEMLNLDNSTPLFEIQHKYKESIYNFPIDDLGVTLSFNTTEEFEKIKKNIN